MKKIILFVAMGMALLNYAHAQYVLLSDTNGNPINSGATLVVEGTPSQTSPMEIHIHVTNNHSSILNVNAKKDEINVGASTTNTFCWGINCFPPHVFDPRTPVQLNPGQTEESFHGDFTPNNYAGVSQMRYVFYTDEFPGDSVYVNVNFVTNMGTNELGNTIKIKSYPNPADEFITLSLSESFDNTIVRFYNVLGEKVYEIAPQKGKTNYSINTGNWDNGMYYYTVFQNGQSTISQKLIINH